MFQNYLTIALRNLQKHRSFAALNTVGLGLSIACCVLIFMLVRHHLSFDTFHQKADRIVLIGTETRRDKVSKANIVPYPMGAALRQEYAFLEKTAMLSARDNTLITIAQDGQAPAKFKEDHTRAFTEPELFEIFDFPLVQGSFLDFKQPYTAVLTEKMAHKYFGTTNAVGKIFKINNKFDFRIVGVLKDLPENTDIPYQIFTSWATLQSDSNSVRMLRNWGGIHGGTQCYALLRESHAASELETAFTTFREKYFHPEVREWYYHAISLAVAHFDPDYGTGITKTYVWTLALIGLFLLFTACVNFVNMATAQALTRAREVGVRKTMGSTRGQLFGQFMAETSVIVLLSTLIGMGLAWAGLPFLNQLAETHLQFDFARDLSMYGFLAALMMVVAFLAGAYPGLVLSGFRPVESLKGGANTQQVGGFSLRRLLVGTQFALSQALIIAAVVVTSQLEYARNADLGFQQAGIVTVPLPGKPNQNAALKEQLAELSGVENVSLCMQPPASGSNWNTGVRFQGKSEDEPWIINFKFADDKYLETFGLRLVAGRNLQPSDTVREYLVNEEVVKKLQLASPEDILGKTLAVDGVPHQVVGVVNNFHNHSFHEKIQPQVIASDVSNYDVAALRIQLQNTKPTLEAIEKTWTSIYPEFFYEQDFMDAQIAEFYQQESIILKLVRLFAGIALFIGCLGLYGLSAFMVTRKTKEIGIRKTLGASVGGILWLFGKEYVRLILLAFLVAAPLSWWAMNTWLQDYAYRISVGMGIFTVSLLATFGIAMVTVGAQSVQAALTNPVKSLRSE